MAEKKLVEAITSMSEDFAQWYTDVVKKAELIDYSNVKGCMVIKPAGYAIWENIQRQLDERFKAVEVENVYMPMFIPESLLQKEKDHVEGFAPEVAWVTHGGLNPLQERMCVRPTSETLFCDFYKGDIHSYRDLPRVYNQWCSVVRWEKETRPFLRSREFLWQEGHTAHATAGEAEERTEQMLNVYADFCEEVLAIPVVKGRKTEKEKFAGAEATYTIEALMHDGKALQSGTSHNFGDGFARAFGIQFTDRDNQLKYVHQTSWGMSTRIIGAIIMVHGDDSGLVLPPRIAPTQVMIIPIQQKKEGVLDKAFELKDRLKAFRVKVDDSDKSPGWKFSEQEMRGIPLRVEIGPKDIEAGKCVICRRDTREKLEVSLDQLEETVSGLLTSIQSDMLTKARKHLEEHIYTATTKEEFEKTFAEKSGFVKAMWCGEQSCEEEIKEKLGVTSRCMPFKQEQLSDTCVCCGRAAKKWFTGEKLTKLPCNNSERNTDTDMIIALPEKVRYILDTIMDAGYEAYAVGGCIRDSILGKEPADWDITTSASPYQVKRLFDRTLDTGIKHGTVTVLLEREGFEVTTYRVDGVYEDGRHPREVTFTSSLLEDLRRRDFTVNAMAFNNRAGLVDAFGGIQDIAAGVIRCVGSPMERFTEDALRMMRAVRFSARLGYRIEEETLKAISALSLNLRQISAERIQTELVSLVTSPHPENLRIAYETGITRVILPEFDACMKTDQNNPHHCYSVGEHTLKSLEEIRPDKILRLAMLFHDIGKPLTQTVDEKGIHHFHGHPAVSERIAETALRRLKFDNHTVSMVTRLVRYHDHRVLPEPKYVRRAILKSGEEIFPLLRDVRQADIMAQSNHLRMEKLESLKAVYQVYEQIIEQKQCVSLKTLAVTGKDLISQAGMQPGPELGKALNRLLNMVIDDPTLNERRILLDIARTGIPEIQ